MANTNDRHLGPSEVEQGKNANEMIDPTDDLPEAKANEVKEITEKDLDRGEELYRGFGFGNTDIERATSTSTNQVESEPVPAVKEVKTTNLEEKNSLTTSNDEVVKKTYDPDIERKIEWEEPIHSQIVRTTITSTDGTDKEPVDKVKVGQTKEIPTDTRVVITPDKGDINYNQSEITSYEASDQAVNYLHSSNRDAYTVESDGQAYEDLYVYEGLRDYTIDQTPDYEEAGIYYGYTPTNKSLYNPIYEDHSQVTIETLPIKHHYKSLRKDKKKNKFPWQKLALGVAATIGSIALIKNLTDDDSDFFWQ